MKIVSAVDFGRETLSASDSSLSDARSLLAHVLQVNLSYLLAHGEEVLSAENITTYFTLIARAEQHEPLPYILGSAAFRYLDLFVSPAVLIPRPETEQLVDLVKKWAKGRNDRLILVDAGTGSGCIAISLATEMENVAVIAVDISAEALTVAQQNANNKASITFYNGSLLEPLPHNVDVIVANLPYIADAETKELLPSVQKFEPSLALRGGKDGLDLIRQLLQQATSQLKPNGAIFLEIGYTQGADATALAHSIFPDASVVCLKDFADNDRFVVIDTSSLL